MCLVNYAGFQHFSSSLGDALADLFSSRRMQHFHRNSPKVGVDAHNCTPVGSGHTHVEGNCSACPSPCAASVQVDPSPQCEGLFQLFDVDRSGQIDVREFMISLTNFAGASKDDKLKFAFMIFDEDGNGVITKQEVSLSSLITKQEAGLESFLRYHGSDRDLIHSWTRISLSWSSDDEPSPRFPPKQERRLLNRA